MGSLGTHLGDALAGYRDRDTERCVNGLVAAITMVQDYEDRIRELEAKLREALAGYTEAIEDIDSWSGYASDYFQKKHKLDETLADHRALLAKLKEDQQ